MLTKIIMPSSGQTTNESQLLKWHKKVGDKIKKGDVLFEIETDKASMEIESYGEGILLATYHNEGEYVTAGEIMAYIGEEGEKLPEDAGKAENNKNSESQPEIKKDIEVISSNVSQNTDTAGILASKTLASPAARYLAKNSKISIEDVARGLSGQVVKREDVANYLNQPEPQKEEGFYYINTSNMRKVIARRMTESVSTAPYFTVTMDVDMGSAIELRNALNEHLKGSGVKVSFNDIIIKCASKAIEKYPAINSTYGEDRIKVYENVNFGLAVGIEGGLVVPVVRQTNNKSIPQIAGENAVNIEKAKGNKLQPADMTGGTITLSNLGMYGADSFTAIINQPESCILAVGRIGEKAVSINGQIVSRQMMTITASFDHRVIDGAYGAAFLQMLKLFLENPGFLLI